MGLQMASKIVNMYRNKDEQYAHLNEADVAKVVKQIEEKKAWMDQSCATLERTDKVTNPTVLVCQFYQEQTAFEKMSKPILNKPKPKIEPPKEDKEENKEASPENTGDLSDIATNEKMNEKANGEKVEDAEMKDAEKKNDTVEKEKKENEQKEKSHPKMVKKKKTISKTIDLPITSQA